MKWYQHETNAHNDEDMRDLIHRFGLEGYGAYVICLELIAEKIDGNLIAEITISDAVLREKLRLSHQKLTKILSFFGQKTLIFSKFSKKYWILKCPALLKRIDNWTTKKAKRYGVTTEQVPLQSQSEREIERHQEPADGLFSEEQVKNTKIQIAQSLGHSVLSEANAENFNTVLQKLKTAMGRKEDVRDPYAYTLTIAKNIGKEITV